MPRGYFIVLSLMAFKVCWLLLVLFQDRFLLPVLLIVALVMLMYPDKNNAPKYIAAIAVPGVLIDSVLVQLGLFDFNAVFIPYWLVLLWICFALTLPHGFSFIQRMPLPYQAIIGGVSSFSYLVGREFGAVEFPYPLFVTQAVLVLIWAALIPLLFRLLQFRQEPGANEQPL